jgi:hypothetical protein
MTPQSPPQASEVLALTDRSNVTSPVVGVAFLDQTRRVSPGGVLFKTQTEATTRVTGSYDHQARVATLSGAGIAFEGQRDVSDSASFLERESRSYDHVRANLTFLGLAPGDERDSDFRVTSNGVFGIATPPEAMPAVGSATFTGFATTTYRDPTLSTYGHADMTMTANFATSRATMIVTSRSENTPDTNYDRWEMTNMRINGSELRGGRPAFSVGGEAVDLFPGDFDKFAEGQFFGSNDETTPDEVGGIVELTDGDIIATMVYIAD